MMSPQQTREARIRSRFICHTQRQKASPGERHQRRRHIARLIPFPGRNEFCNDFPSVRYQNRFTGSDLPNVLAQAVLQIPKADALHIH